MGMVLYDLAAADGRRFSPYCWRTRMALAHKGLDCEARPVRFHEIATICGGGQKTVPVLDDDGHLVSDSGAIAAYLDEAYPDRSPLLGGATGAALCRFVESWTASTLLAGLFPMLVADIHGHLAEQDKAYFRADRERRLGRALEAAAADRAERLPAFTQGLQPLRLTLRAQPFLGGAAPHYADYVVFGAFQWARTISDFRVLAEDDPVWAWAERCRDLHGGLAREGASYY